MSDDPRSAMRDMSRAIRLQLEQFGPTLRDIPTTTLREMTTIVTAFSLDMKAELDRRDDEV